ncbi:MAG: universal stress protein [Usitatibacteraceae bacterium]
MFKHILICTDGSALSKKSAKTGIALARGLGAKITIYYAQEDLLPVYSEGYTFDAQTADRFEGAMRAVGQKRVDAIGVLAKAARVPFVTLVTKAFAPDEGIINAAKKQKCDAIVMASHGRSGLSKLFMGSVTQKVLSHSKLPVIVCR